jgi:predicted RNase H-like HicB family nuclease
MVYKVNVVFTEDEHGFYVYCPELPGCHSQGDSFEEAKTNIREALDLYMETMSKEEIEAALNKEILTTTMEVKVA